MAAKPLNEEQLRDADRLKAIFESRKQIDRGMTQEALAHACGWKTQGAVNQYLTGKIPLNAKAAMKFARALNCSIADFSPTLSGQMVEYGIEAASDSELKKAECDMSEPASAAQLAKLIVLFGQASTEGREFIMAAAVAADRQISSRQNPKHPK